jgi:DNA mismatch repair ATPase MutS
MFFDDAIIGNQILNLNWMGNDPKKLHVGFPENALSYRAEKLVNNGFKIAVIEQTETPEQLKNRVKSGNKVEKTVKRELCNVFTKGTYYKFETDEKFIKKENQNIRNKNKFCCALFCQLKENKIDGEVILDDDDNISKNGYEWGICLFDVTTLKFYLGKIEEDSAKFIPKSQSSQTIDNTFNKIKTLLYNISPEEIICVKQNLPESISSFINDLATKPIITYLKYNYKFNNLNDLCQKYFGKDFQKWDKVIINQFSNEKENHATCVSLYLTIIYFQETFPLSFFQQTTKLYY